MPLVALQKPGTPTLKSDAKFSPGTTAKLSPTREPVPPQRPRMPSRTDEIDTQTGSAIERKGVTPRAPSVVSSREVTAPSLDIKEIVTNAVKEATAPLQVRIARLEDRIRTLEADFQEAASPDETRPNAAMPYASSQASPPTPAYAPAPIPPPVINAPAFAPASPFSNVPASSSAFPPAPASVAPVALLPAPRPAFVSVPPQQINFEDAHLSPDEVAMFDGNKRSRRMVIYFVLVLVLLGGLLGLWASISRG